jgi:hypothetical protein
MVSDVNDIRRNYIQHQNLLRQSVASKKSWTFIQLCHATLTDMIDEFMPLLFFQTTKNAL